jgi:hypothetical protein
MFLINYKKEIVKHYKLIYEILFIICLMTYISSCFLPCYSTEHETAMGYYCLLGGWFCLFVDFWLFLIWCSNILFFCSILAAIKYSPKCVWFSLISVVSSISMLFHRYIVYDIIVPILSFHIGYYLWCASFLLHLVICIFRMLTEMKYNNVTE